MIEFALQDEPEKFNERCRVRGNRWLSENEGYERPADYWSEFKPELREAFSGLCAYCAMRIMDGQVDHFRPISILKEEGNDSQAYEWKNFRYGEGIINRKKWKHIVLDPFDVREGWFEIQLPSLQLVATNKIPERKYQLALFTIQKLGLQDSEVVVRYRQTLFQMYREGKITLEGLRYMAPLLADAVQKDLDAGKSWKEN